MRLRHERGQAPEFEAVPPHLGRLSTHVAVGEFLGLPATQVGDLDPETFYGALILMQARGIMAKRQHKQAAKPAKGR